MNARSKFVPLTSGLFRKRVEDVVHNRRSPGRKKLRTLTRTIKHYTGLNKGKVYPWGSYRQLKRQLERVNRGN